MTKFGVVGRTPGEAVDLLCHGVPEGRIWGVECLSQGTKEVFTTRQEAQTAGSRCGEELGIRKVSQIMSSGQTFVEDGGPHVWIIDAHGVASIEQLQANGGLPSLAVISHDLHAFGELTGYLLGQRSSCNGPDPQEMYLCLAARASKRNNSPHIAVEAGVDTLR